MPSIIDYKQTEYKTLPLLLKWANKSIFSMNAKSTNFGTVWRNTSWSDYPMGSVLLLIVLIPTGASNQSDSMLQKKKNVQFLLEYNSSSILFLGWSLNL